MVGSNSKVVSLVPYLAFITVVWLWFVLQVEISQTNRPLWITGVISATSDHRDKSENIGFGRGSVSSSFHRRQRAFLFVPVSER